MSELMRKEIKDCRGILIGLLIIAPVASLLVKFALVGVEKVGPGDSVSALIPFLLALYGVAVAADLVAADSGSGRHAFLAALPVAPARLWWVKARFLFGGMALYLLFLLVLETFVVTLSGLPPDEIFSTGIGKHSIRLVPAVVVAAAVLCFSTLIDRGFAAVLAAIATLGGLFAVAWWLHPNPKQATTAVMLGSAALLTAAFLTGSFLAFTRGRIHLGSRVRRIALAMAAFGVVFLLPVAGSIVRAARWIDLRVTDENVTVHVHEIDEHRAIVWLDRPDAYGPFEVETPALRLFVPLDGGPVRITGNEEDIESSWQVHYENGARAIREKRNWEISRPGMEPIRLGHGMHAARCANEWGIVLRRDHAKRSRTWEWILDLRTGDRRPVPCETGYFQMILMPATPDGIGFAFAHFMRSKRLVLARVPMDGSRVEFVAESFTRGQGACSPDGRRLVGVTTTVHLLRAEGAEMVEVDVPTAHARPAVTWERNGDRFVIEGPDWFWLVDASEPSPTGVRLPIPADTGKPRWFEGDRVLFDGPRLTLWKLDGTHRQLLPVKEKK